MSEHDEEKAGAIATAAAASLTDAPLAPALPNASLVTDAVKESLGLAKDPRYQALLQGRRAGTIDMATFAKKKKELIQELYGEST